MKARRLPLILACLLSLGPALHAQTIVFSSDLDSLTVGSRPGDSAANPGTPWSPYGVSTGLLGHVETAPGFFGSGNVLHLLDNSTSGLTKAGPIDVAGSETVMKLSFEFYEPSGVDGAAFNVRAGVGNDTDANLAFGIGFSNGTAAGVAGAYTLNAAHQVDIYFNISSSALMDYAGTQDLASNRYDLWIDGVLVFNDGSRTGGPGVGTNVVIGSTPLDSFVFSTFSSGSAQEVYLDNIVYSTVPEPAALALLLLGASVPCFVRRRRSPL